MTQSPLASLGRLHGRYPPSIRARGATGINGRGIAARAGGCGLVGSSRKTARRSCGAAAALAKGDVEAGDDNILNDLFALARYDRKVVWSDKA
jgi:hypothetical protein